MTSFKQLGKTGLTSLTGAQLAILGLIATSAQGATVTLTGLDAIGNSSFNSAGFWDNAAAPSAGNDYFVVDGTRLRTPGDGASYTFAGDSLTINNTTPYSEGLMFKGTGNAGVITIPNLILDGGLISHAQGTGDLFQLDGAVTVSSDSRLYAKQGNIDILADISGTGGLEVLATDDNTNSGARILTLYGDNSGYTGDIDVSGKLHLGDTGALAFNIGASGVNNSISGTGWLEVNGIFEFDLTGASSNPGDTWTITNVANQIYNETFSVTGFTQSGSVWTDGTYTFNPLSGELTVAAPPLEWNVDADGNWSTGANWSTGTAPSAGGDALLGAVITANRTITLDTNVSLNSLALSNAGDGDYFIVPDTNQSLTLTGEAKLDVAGRHWMRAEVASTIGVYVEGTGELVLDADNSFTGGLSVDGATVSIVHDDALPATNDIAVTNGGVVQFFGADNTFFADNGSAGYGTGTVDGNVSVDADSSIGVNDGADVTFSGVISGDGSVSANNGIVGFNTAHTYGGTTTLSGASTLTVSGAGTLGAADGTAATRTIINDSAQLVLDNASLGDEFIVLGERNVDATASISSAGNNTIAGNIYADIPGTGSHYIIESTSGTLTLSGTISAWDEAEPNDRLYVFEGAGDIKVTGKITDLAVDEKGDPTVDLISNGNNVHVVKRGSGTLTIATSTTNGNDFWRGPTVVEEGTLKVQAGASDAGELYSSNIQVQAGAVFDTSTFTTYSMQVTEDPDGVAFNGDEIGQTIGGAGTINAGSGKISAFEDAVFAPGDDGVGTLNITGGLSITPTVANPNGGLDFELSGSAAGTNDQIAVSGTVTLGASGGGQYNLNVTPVGGALDTSAYTLISGGSGSGSVSASDFNVAIFNSQGTQLDTRQDDSVTIGFSGGDLTVQFAATESMNWTGAVNSTWDIGATGNWSSSDSLFYDLDSVSFSGTNTINVAATVTPDGVSINSGSTTFTGAGIQGSGDLSVAAGASAVFNNDGVNTIGNVNLGAGASLVENQSTGETQLNGNLTGSGALNVTAGQVVLSGDNTAFTGTMNVNGGTLNLNNANGLGGTVSVNSGGRLLSNADTYTSNAAFTLNGGTFAVGGGAVAAVELAGPINISASGGSFQIDGGTGADGLTVSGNITGAAAGALNINVDGDSTMTVSGNITNNGVLNKTGSGVLALGATTTVASPTINVNGGTLDVSSQAAFSMSSGQTLTGTATVSGNVTASSGSTLRVGGAGLPITPSQFVIDDFESYNLGGVIEEGAPWADHADSTYADIEDDGTGNQVLAYGHDDASDPVYGAVSRPIPAAGTVDDSSVATFFFRMNSKQDDPDHSFGISDGTDTAAGFSFGSFEAQVAFVDDGDSGNGTFNMVARNGGSSSSVATGLTPNTWYNIWVVVDQTTDTYDVYQSTGTADATVANLVADDFAFRNGTTTALNTLLGAWAPSPIDNQVMVDDITYLAGEDLTNPLGGLNPGDVFQSESMTISGDLVLSAGATLEMDIATVDALDLLTVTGNLTAGGTLEVTLAGTAPALAEGDAFDILDFASATGSFATLNLPALDAGLSWDTSNLLVSGIIEVIAGGQLDGDLNGDGFVGLDDLDIVLTRWNQNVTPGDWTQGDPSGDGFVGLADLDFVLINWNNGTPPSSNAAIPEPASLALLGLGGMALIRRR